MSLDQVEAEIERALDAQVPVEVLYAALERLSVLRLTSRTVAGGGDGPEDSAVG